MRSEIVNGFASATNGEKKVECVVFDGRYTLIVTDYASQYAICSTICEDKARLSTINKYAEKYGVTFVK